ncbi:YwqG family protein [Phenylobacterium sp. J367]|uniref:YwqG family protein n=1 Tax=Phenylobacterium sp. J367 TaxID=2898435 RepID=UPI002151CCEE|nr:YwqG family protein [Phenylobacterium sp. J367]MCR5877238.1 DUF1963 domain-containing protein [Phenylobacterium sp. J367]
MIGATVAFVIVMAALGLWLVRRLSAPSAEEREALAASRAEYTRKVIGDMQRLAQPALTLVPAEPAGFSKLGGEPDLPPDVEWPRAEGRALAFLAQLDLEEVRSAGGPDWLPGEGRLWAFNDDDRYGMADHVRIVHAASDAATVRHAFPDDLRKRHRFGEQRVGFRLDIVGPSLEWLGVDSRELDISRLSESELAAAPQGPHHDERQHRIGGYPSEIQDERMSITAELLARGLPASAEVSAEIEDAARDWRLLLQIDSDPALGMNFGDAGRLYVFIKETHARAGDFSKTVANWQTY